MVITNDALSALVETNDEWIATRTGIRNRRVLSGQHLQSFEDTKFKYE